MLVRLGACVPEINTNSYRDLQSKISKRLDYNLRKADDFNLSGYSHVRLNNLIGSYSDRQEFIELVTSGKFDEFRGWYSLLGYTTSIHVPYHYNMYSLESTIKSTKYISDICLLLNRLGLKRTMLNMHIKCNRYTEGLLYTKFLKKLNFYDRQRLIFENDDRGLNVQQTLDLSQKAGKGFVYDNLHDKLNPSTLSLEEQVLKIKDSWFNTEGTPVIHYSTGDLKGHGDIVIVSEILYILRLYKFLFDEVILILEVKGAKRANEYFRYNTSSIVVWRDDFSFII